MRVSAKTPPNLTLINDTQSIKEAISKLNSTKQNQLKPNNIQQTINTLLRELSGDTKTKEVVLQEIKQSDISKMIKSTTSELKALLNFIKNDKTLSRFTPILEKLILHVKDISPEALKQELAKSGVLMEAKLSSIKVQTMPTLLKETLVALKNLLIKTTPKQDQTVLKAIEVLLGAKRADKDFELSLQNLIRDIKNSPDLSKKVSLVLRQIEDLKLKDTTIKELLNHLKQTILKTPQESALKDIEKILNAPKADKGFIDEIKTLITNLRQSKALDRPIVQIVAKLEDLVQKSLLIESKIQNSTQSTPQEIAKVTTQIKQILNRLEILTLNPAKESILEKKSQEILKLVEQTLKTIEFFPRELSRATISEKIKQIVNLIKSEMIKSDAKSPLHVEVAKLVNKLEIVMKEQIATKQIVPNQRLLTDISIKHELVNDIKSVLLSIKSELATQTTSSSREIFLQVDRLLIQIESFQLLSLSSNSLSTYLPFLWDGLQEGQVSLKSLEENRFFCEINLKLKEHGKIDLMMILFEEIHLNISMFAEKKEFISLVRENLSSLKQGINRLGLIPLSVELKIRETEDEVQSHSLGAGLNIEA